VPVLLSGPFHDALSHSMKKYLRQIDVVSANDSVMSLFTADLQAEDLPVSKEIEGSTVKQR
jgi:hypothetical protein